MNTRTKIVIGVTVVAAAVAGGTVVGRLMIDQPVAKPSTWTSSITTRTANATSHAGIAYKFSVDVPSFAGVDSPALAAVNGMLRDRADKAVDDFLKVADAPGEPSSAPFTLTEKATVHRAGRIAAIEYTSDEFAGGAHGAQGRSWVLVRTDTWATIGRDQILLPAAGTPDGATKLANAIAPNVNGMSNTDCTTDAATLLADGQGGSGSGKPSAFEGRMGVGVWPTGLEFVFTSYYLFAYSCGPGIATVPFTALNGLVDPDIVRLATAQS